MLKAIAVLSVMVLAGCATQPHASLPPQEERPSVMSPEPDATTVATDMAMFGERLMQAVAVVVSGFFSPELSQGR